MKHSFIPILSGFTKGNENKSPADVADVHKKKSAVICPKSFRDGNYFHMKFRTFNFLKIFAVVVFLLCLTMGCNTCNKQKSTREQLMEGVEMGEDGGKIPAQLSAEVLDEVIHSVPSPIEFTYLLKEIKAEYLEECLNAVDNADKYATNYKKALNLGIYGADLSYVNLYNKSHTTFRYLSVLKYLSEELKIGQFFDFNTLERLAGNRENMDSLISITTNSFDKMNNYLQQQNRVDISIQILIGGWLEGLYLVTQISKNNSSEALVEIIASQKMILEKIIQLTSAYKNNKEFDKLNKDLITLKEVFDNITINTVADKNPTTKVENGMMVSSDKSSTNINISKEQLKQIIKATEKIRNRIID